jgi:sugar phosphate isomerase/epimerase
MTRRHFLMASAAATAVAGRSWAQSPDKAKLDRIAILTLNFDSILKNPAHPDDSKRTLDLMDIPGMFAEHFGVHWVEPYHTHFRSTEKAYFDEFKDRLKKANSRVNQISVGGMGTVINMSSPDLLRRLECVDLTKRWIDHCAELGCTRLQVNQGSLAPEVREDAIKALKAMADYGKTKKPTVYPTLETRGDPPNWRVVVDVIKPAGARANPDCGNFPNEEERQAGLRVMYPLSTGSSHVHYAPDRWSLPDAIAIAKEVGYKGMFGIEASASNGPDPYSRTQTIIDALLPLI